MVRRGGDSMRTETNRQSYAQWKVGGAILGFMLLGLGPVTALAQENQDKKGGTESGQAEKKDEKKGEKTNLNDKHVSLNVEQVSLSEALRQLMKSVQAEYVIDSALKEATVTLH